MKINPLDHLGLVKQLTQRYHLSSGENYDDLYQEGYIGLHKAAKRFDPSLGYQFSVFAYPNIRGAITHYLRDRSNLIKCRGVRIPCDSLDKEIYHDGDMTLLDTLHSAEKEDYSELYDAVDRLPKRQKAVMLLKLRGEGRAAISDRLNVSKQTVSSRTVRAKAKLRELLTVH